MYRCPLPTLALKLQGPKTDAEVVEMKVFDQIHRFWHLLRAIWYELSGRQR
jgi:hypothetical protein